MNLTAARVEALSAQIATVAKDYAASIDVAVFPPACYLAQTVKAAGDAPWSYSVGAQNMHPDRSGAYTGELSGYMIKELGGTMVLCGHSERRQLFGETAAFVGTKVSAAHRDGLVPILCVGETLDERERGATEDVIREQLVAGLLGLQPALVAETVIAYEPVWAIGTGRHASPELAGDVHRFIREWLTSLIGAELAGDVRILYGGSVKPDNAEALLAVPDIDGALVGGASLEAQSFTDIIRSASR